MDCGNWFTCGLRLDGRLRCWGFDSDGEVSGPNASVDSFEQVSAGGAHTCARTADSALWCWGSNEYGQLGIAGGQSSLVPVQIAPACP